jgi:hypothetical protein
MIDLARSPRRRAYQPDPARASRPPKASSFPEELTCSAARCCVEPPITGSRRPIEVIEYDDRSSAEEVVRAIERLANQDEIDFILPAYRSASPRPSSPPTSAPA